MLFARPLAIMKVSNLYNVSPDQDWCQSDLRNCALSNVGQEESEEEGEELCYYPGILIMFYRMHKITSGTYMVASRIHCLNNITAIIKQRI